jgi:penicillin-binding protein 2
VLVNRAVQGQYNMGSSFKPFVAWAAMHSGVLGPQEQYLDQGVYKLESVADDVCAQGVRCEFKNASNIRTNLPSSYGPVTVADALAVSSDAFFYRLGEKFWEMDEHNAVVDPALKGKSTLKDDLERFGFGSESGVQLPFEWSGRSPDDAVKKELVDKHVLAKGEQPRLLVGDNVQVAIGQGLMAATPLQMANAYSTIANGGFLRQPTVVKNIYEPLVPDLSPGMADLSKAVVYQSFEAHTYKDQLEMPPDIRNPIINGLKRVTNADRVREPGVRYPKSFYHTTTGEKLFETYPMSTLPIAGKTGTAQGANSYPWNDSSAFAAFSLDDSKPYTVFAYLEKSGFGAKAAAPVVKCIFTALAGKTAMDPVLPSDQLDLNSLLPAAPTQLADTTCMPPAVDARD